MTVPFSVGIKLFAITLLATVFQANVRAMQPIEVFTEPYQIIELAAAEAGILDSIMVKQGDIIQAGDLIANLDRDVLLATMEIAKLRANLHAPKKRAMADIGQKQRRYKKLMDLHANGHASEEEIDSAKATLEIAEAGLLEVSESQRLAMLQTREIEAQLRRREIRSPISGQVVKLEKNQGEYVATLDPVVARIVQLDKLRVKFYIDTEMARSIHKGDLLPMQFVDSNLRAKGAVEFVSPTTDADSRTVRVEVVIDNSKGDFRSGVPVRLDTFGKLARIPQ